MENESPILYYVDKEYLKYLHKEDYRVSVKFNNRPFAGIVTLVGDRKYIIPLTSQTTEERKNAGKNKRSSLITTFVTETSGKEISNLLYNNMIPVNEQIIKLNNKYYIKRVIGVAGDTVDIDYADGKIIINGEEQNEDYIYEPIKKKAEKIFNQRYDIESHNFNFLKKTCCDFKKLEKALDQFEIRQEEK